MTIRLPSRVVGIIVLLGVTAYRVATLTENTARTITSMDVVAPIVTASRQAQRFRETLVSMPMHRVLERRRDAKRFSRAVPVRAIANTSHGESAQPGVETSARQAHLQSPVDKPARPAPGSPTPKYPNLLKITGVEGEVVVEFVVDTTGLADVSTFKVVTTTHGMFADAYRNALPKMRFLPAENGGKKVKQLLRQSYVFKIPK
jgi:TonB family protein